MKKIFLLLYLLFIYACSSEENVIYKSINKDDFLAKANIVENTVSNDMCNGNVIENCNISILNDNTYYAYGFDITCSYPTYTYFNTADAIQSFYHSETVKDNFETTKTIYNRFISDDPTYEYITFSAISIPNADNKIYLTLNNMCYEWDFSQSQYKFIK